MAEAPQIVSKFRRHVAALGGIYARMDAGTLTGRNAVSTDGTVRMHAEAARRLLREDAATWEAPLCAYLDSKHGSRLAAKWHRIERRYYGLS